MYIYHAHGEIFQIMDYLVSLIEFTRHQFVNEELILKAGLVDKRKVLLACSHLGLFYWNICDDRECSLSEDSLF